MNLNYTKMIVEMIVLQNFDAGADILHESEGRVNVGTLCNMKYVFTFGLVH